MPLDEIIVREPRLTFEQDFERYRDTFNPIRIPPKPAGGSGGSPSTGPGAFVPPALAPVIEEIITTAPRPNAPPVVSGWAQFFSRMGLPALVGAVGGFTAREIFEELGEQMLEESYAELMAPDSFVPYETPVLPMQPEVLPEIIVREQRLTAIQALQYPPLPQFFPLEADPDPWIMQPIVPRTMPQTRPQVETFTEIPLPTFPEVAPARPAVVPLASPRVEIAPFVQPWTQPWTHTQPQTSPRVQPQIQTEPLTSLENALQQSVRTSLSQQLAQQTLTQTQASAARCPPCKKGKEREKPRDRCYKKLVKESVYPSWDESYEWTEIDCLTGREL